VSGRLIKFLQASSCTLPVKWWHICYIYNSSRDGSFFLPKAHMCQIWELWWQKQRIYVVQYWASTLVSTTKHCSNLNLKVICLAYVVLLVYSVGRLSFDLCPVNASVDYLCRKYIQNRICIKIETVPRKLISYRTKPFNSYELHFPCQSDIGM
jgi:hypothetical protein